MKESRASFHTPGHKSRLAFPGKSDVFALDVTELPGLDDLSYPSGMIRDLELRLAALYRVSASLISLNGASAGLMAAILCLSRRGQYVLVPRNAHRSIIHGLVLAGLNVKWYEPRWSADWAVFAGVSGDDLESLISGSEMAACAGVVVVSPTYTGALSEPARISELCHRYELPLIVDEAHGAHFFANGELPVSACHQGADLVVHSLHKTLPCLTQTGLISIPFGSLIAVEDVRANLRLVVSSSPSYPLICSIEQMVGIYEQDAGLALMQDLVGNCLDVKARIARLEGFEVFSSSFGDDPLHIALRRRAGNSLELFEHLAGNGLMPEARIGNAVLLMAGAGTLSRDFDLLLEVLSAYEPMAKEETHVERPESIKQEMSPREAFLAPSDTVSLDSAIGRVAAECIAFCPPGIPVCVPGGLVPQAIKKLASMVDSVRVVSE